MRPNHFKAFLNEALSIYNSNRSVGSDIIDSLYAAKEFLDSVKIKATAAQVLIFAERE